MWLTSILTLQGERMMWVLGADCLPVGTVLKSCWQSQWPWRGPILGPALQPIAYWLLGRFQRLRRRSLCPQSTPARPGCPEGLLSASDAISSFRLVDDMRPELLYFSWRPYRSRSTDQLDDLGRQPILTRSSLYKACDRPVEKTSKESLANFDSHSSLKALRALFSLSLWSTCIIWD